jgi:hypothetical protein
MICQQLAHFWEAPSVFIVADKLHKLKQVVHVQLRDLEKSGWISVRPLTYM